MNILIDQAGFINRGAELMFCSVVEQLRRQYPTAQLLIPMQEMNKGGYEYCEQNGIKSVKGGFAARLELSFYKLCAKLKLIQSDSNRLFVHTKDIDVIIDAGGFRFGDQWRYNIIMYWYTKFYYSSFKRGCKVIFMPQSFGPFKDNYSIKTTQAVLKRVGLAYAREEESLRHLEQIVPKSVKVCFKRDFTLLHKHDTYISSLLSKGDYVVVIPNKKMITHSTLGDGAYINFICQIVQSLHQRGERVYLLNHEGAGDNEICEQINSRLQLNLPIMSGLRAMPVKNVIGGAKLVISSRFHGVVSGIVQQVPTFCTSWSHKYNELLATYGIDGNLLDVNSVEESLAKLTSALESPDKYIAKSEIISRERESIESMWSDIFNYIDSLK